MKPLRLLIFICTVLIVSCQSKPNDQNDLIPDAYQEAHRNQFHFSPKANWMNDPNGMFYLDGEYHLYYQYYPDSTVWGPMHWGHAISKDMIQWEEIEIALYPDSLGYIFSGSAVVDHNNTSGFGNDSTKAVIAIFTHHDINGERTGTNDFQYQSIAYSLDNGRSFTKYAANPVIANPGIKDFRDPKVIWDDKRAQWVMVFAAYDKVMIYTSPNLKAWTYKSEFGIEGDHRLWECPDLFPMKVEGTNEEKWVLITSMQKNAPNGGTASSYFIGDFNGESFIPDNDQQYWLDYGKDNYAFVTWSDIPDNDGRKLGIGWMSNWQYAQIVPTHTWRSAMTIAREISLHKNGDEYMLHSIPVKELKELEITESKKLEPGVVNPISPLARINFQIDGDSTFELIFTNTEKDTLRVAYDSENNYYLIDRRNAGQVNFQEDFADKIHTAPVLTKLDKHAIEILLDLASIEIFANDGQTVMTDIFFSNPFTELTIINEDGREVQCSYHQLRSIW